MKTITTFLFSIFTTLIFSQQLAEKTWPDHTMGSCQKEIADTIGNDEEAILYYRKAFQMTFSDSIGNNYKNSAAKNLVDIYINRKNYRSALKYLTLAEKKYPYQTSCATAFALDQIFMADRYAVCYLAQKRHRKAIDVLTSFIFQDNFGGNRELIKKLYSAYLNCYSREEIKNAFIQSTNTLIFNKIKYKQQVYLRPVVTLFHRKVFIPASILENDEWEMEAITVEERRQKYVAAIRNSAMYKMVTE